MKIKTSVDNIDKNVYMMILSYYIENKFGFSGETDAWTSTDLNRKICKTTIKRTGMGARCIQSHCRTHEVGSTLERQELEGANFSFALSMRRRRVACFSLHQENNSVRDVGWRWVEDVVRKLCQTP